MKTSKIKCIEGYIWECERCGRKGSFKFDLHSTSKLINDCCKGKVRRIKWKNAW